MLTTTEPERIISPVEDRTEYRPYCETWGDHDFSAMRLIDAGKDPRRGTFQTFQSSCSKCPKKITQTEWTGLHSVSGGDLA